MAHHLAADFFVHVKARLLEIRLERRVEVAALMFQFEEPGHVINAGGQEIDLRLGHIRYSWR